MRTGLEPLRTVRAVSETAQRAAREAVGRAVRACETAHAGLRHAQNAHDRAAGELEAARSGALPRSGGTVLAKRMAEASQFATRLREAVERARNSVREASELVQEQERTLAGARAEVQRIEAEITAIDQRIAEILALARRRAENRADDDAAEARSSQVGQRARK